MVNSSHWGANGQIPLEDALRLALPVQKCYVYRIDVGGDSYIGMTTLDPQIALANHIEDARAGDLSRLHVALRRFGYMCDFTTISDHDTEVNCLVAKVSQIQRFKPTLNPTFGGEGNQFNLIEAPNKMGELALHVENKQVRRRLSHDVYKSSTRYLLPTLERIGRRFDKLEQKLPKERIRFADELWEIWSPAHGNQITRQAVFDYADKRRERYARLTYWSSETQRSVEAHKNVIIFAQANGFTMLTKGKYSHLKSYKSGLILSPLNPRAYTYSASKKTFIVNPAYFKAFDRVFYLEFGKWLTNTVFEDKQQAKNWLVQQSWFKSAVRDGIVKVGDAFFPFLFSGGAYGGFLGMFTKVEHLSDHLIVDQEMLSSSEKSN